MSAGGKTDEKDRIPDADDGSESDPVTVLNDDPVPVVFVGGSRNPLRSDHGAPPRENNERVGERLFN